MRDLISSNSTLIFSISTTAPALPLLAKTKKKVIANVECFSVDCTSTHFNSLKLEYVIPRGMIVILQWLSATRRIEPCLKHTSQPLQRNRFCPSSHYSPKTEIQEMPVGKQRTCRIRSREYCRPTPTIGSVNKA